MKWNLSSTANGLLLLCFAAATLNPLSSVFGQCPCEPTILQQPQNQTALQGETVSFSVLYSDPTATNPPITSCQWFLNSTNYTGPGVVTVTSNSCTLTLTNVSPALAGNYFATACNAGCCGIFCGPIGPSQSAILSVVPLRIDAVNLAGPALDQFVLSFLTLANRTYSVQFRAGADAGPWSNVVSIAAQPNTGVVSVTNEIAAGTVSGFYRLVSPSQP